MTQTIVTRRIDAPIERVFDTVCDIGNFSQAIPDIVNVEFTSETRRGVGTRFKETRLMNPLIKGMIKKAIEKDMDSVKSFCEAGDAS